MDAGLYTDMPAETYHADPCTRPSLSNSIAKILLDESPAHAWIAHPRLNPNFQPEEKAAFDLGSAAHALLLEGADRMTVIPFPDFRTKAAQELRDAARALGKHPILEKNYEAVLQMVEKAKEAIVNCPDLGGLTLADGTPEPVLIWTNGETHNRARLDWLSADRSIILDYKTTAASANPIDWQRTMLNGSGDLQPAFYLEGNTATGGPENAKFIWLVQETREPYACAFIGVAPELLELGRQKVEAARMIWQSCLNAARWPAYSPRIHWLTPPAWAESRWMERQEEEQASGHPFDPAKMYEGIAK